MPTANKTVPTATDVLAFLDRVDDPVRRAECYTLVALLSEAAHAPPVMWGTSIVGFGAYHYVYDSGREGDAPAIGFSPRRNDLTLYVMPGFAEREALLAKLGKHRLGKACLYIKKLSDVDLGVLRAIAERSLATLASRRTDR